jgi:TonB family protein
MNALLVYMLKAAFYLAAFYLIFSILLSRDKSYARNRAFILISLASAMILPNFTLQNIKPIEIQFFGKYLSEVFITASQEGPEKLIAGSPAIVSLYLVYLIYLTGVAVFSLKMLIDLINLLFLIFRKRNKESRIIRFHGFNTAGFSAMGYVFINTRLNVEEADEIIRHEQNHLKRNHFVDIIFVGMIKAFQWFNPVIYLFNRSLRAIHEYEADQECLTSGVPVVDYQSLLLNQVFRTKSFTLTNSFSNPSLVKKRMMMMTKKRTSALADLKIFAVIPVIGVMILIISAFRESNRQDINLKEISLDKQIPGTESSSDKSLQPPKVQEHPTMAGSDTIWQAVEEMPQFVGGDEALLKYISQNIAYPESAKKNNIQGKVIVRFCITAEGEISQVSVLKGVSADLDNEAIRVVKTLPAFKPGKNGGKPVPVWYLVPIIFSLK